MPPAICTNSTMGLLGRRFNRSVYVDVVVPPWWCWTSALRAASKQAAGLAPSRPDAPATSRNNKPTMADRTARKELVQWVSNPDQPMLQNGLARLVCLTDGFRQKASCQLRCDRSPAMMELS